MIDVLVTEVSRYAQFDIRFSRAIRLPRNCTDWNDENEGSNRIDVELLVSENTEAVLDEQDLNLTMTWRIGNVTINNQDESRRSLDKEKDNPLVEVFALQV